MEVFVGDMMRSKVKCLHSLRSLSCKPWESSVSYYLFRLKYKRLDPVEMFLITIDKSIYS